MTGSGVDRKGAVRLGQAGSAGMTEDGPMSEKAAVVEKTTAVAIKPPNIGMATLYIRGQVNRSPDGEISCVPLVIHRFSQKVKNEMLSSNVQVRRCSWPGFHRATTVEIVF